jgi:hypothetical protein
VVQFDTTDADTGRRHEWRPIVHTDAALANNYDRSRRRPIAAAAECVAWLVRFKPPPESRRNNKTIIFGRPLAWHSFSLSHRHTLKATPDGHGFVARPPDAECVSLPSSANNYSPFALDVDGWVALVVLGELAAAIQARARAFASQPPPPRPAR